MTARGNWKRKTKGGLVRSDDGCRTFRRLPMPYGLDGRIDEKLHRIEEPNVNAGWVAMSPDTQNIVWSIADGIDLPAELVVASNDSGNTYFKVNIDNCPGKFKVFADRVDNDVFYGFSEAGQFFVSTDGGKAEFVEIDWDNKIMELDGKTIDCVWNGMTLTDEVTSSMACSDAYCNNAQVVIVPKDKADKYQTVDSIKELTFAVEAGSAGEDQAKALGLNYTAVKAQADALMEVAAGTSDAAIIDSLMAAAMVGEGTGYDKLTYTVGLNSEEYGVGFRKDSDLVAELNKFFADSKADGSMEKCAETYKVQAALAK